MTPPPVLPPRQSLLWPAMATAVVAVVIVAGFSKVFSDTTVTVNGSNTVVTSNSTVSVNDGQVFVSVNGSTITSSSKIITGSGKALTEKREIAGFTGIESYGAAEVEAGIGPTTAVTVTTDDNLLSAIVTKVEGKTLRITTNQPYSTKLGVKVKITVPSLVAVALAGSGSAQISGLANTRFDAAVSGSGSADLKGTANQVHFQLAGSGSVSARELIAKTAQISIAGSGSATVWVTDSLEATVAGSGSVVYSGQPATLRTNVMGSGTIQAK